MNQVAIVQDNRPSVDFGHDKVELIKKTVAKDATDLELKLFIEQCKRTQLDPILRQIYFIKDHTGKVQIQTSIDGFRLVAERSGVYEGQTQPMWCGEDGVWKDVWLTKKPPAACKVGVYKKGFREALTAIAVFDEYCQRKKDGSLQFMWGKMPALMISKVAESLALRKAFPNDLSGLYTQEEMAQATIAEESNEKPVVVHQASTPSFQQQQPDPAPSSIRNNPPREDDGEGVPEAIPTQYEIVEDDYSIPFGQYVGKRFSDVDGAKLTDYYKYCKREAEATAQKEGRPIRPKMAEFLEKAESYLRSSGFLSHS